MADNNNNDTLKEVLNVVLDKLCENTDAEAAKAAAENIERVAAENVSVAGKSGS